MGWGERPIPDHREFTLDGRMVSAVAAELMVARERFGRDDVCVRVEVIGRQVNLHVGGDDGPSYRATIDTTGNVTRSLQ